MIKIGHSTFRGDSTFNENCDVPDCDQPRLCAWRFKDIGLKVCLYHLRRHNNRKDKFSLFDLLGRPKLKNVKLDRLGLPIPHDIDEMEIVVRDYAAERKIKSIERLKKWKAGHREPVRKLSEKRDWTRRRKPEMDDIVGNILNGD
jgi:hypothetical protein